MLQSMGSQRVRSSPLVIATGVSIPLLCLEGVPDLSSVPIPGRIAAPGMDAPRILADSHSRPYRQLPGRNTGPSTPESAVP